MSQMPNDPNDPLEKIKRGTPLPRVGDIQEQIERLQRVQTPDEISGNQYHEIADSFAPNGHTLFTAILQGLSRAKGDAEISKGKKATKKKVAEKEKLLEAAMKRDAYKADMEAYMTELETKVKRADLAKRVTAEAREPLMEASRQFVTTGRVDAFERVAQNDQIKKVVSYMLPEGAHFSGRFRDVGQGKFAPVGVDAEGREVVGEAMTPYDFVRDADGVKQLLELQGKVQGMNESQNFIIRTDEGIKSFYGSEQDARAAAEQMGGTLAGTGKVEVSGTELATGGLSEPSSLAVGKSGMNQIDKELLAAGSAISRLTEIQNTFKPEYLEYGTQFKGWLTGKAAKLGMEIDEETRQKVGDYREWVAKAAQDQSLKIKELSGAAVSDQEAKRLQQFLLNPETDDPMQAERKMKALMKEVKYAQARLSYAKRNGLSFSVEDLERELPLDKMGSLIASRGRQVLGQLQADNPDADPLELRTRAAEVVRNEFGLAL